MFAVSFSEKSEKHRNTLRRCHMWRMIFLTNWEMCTDVCTPSTPVSMLPHEAGKNRLLKF
nr:MAG TPA: hypothetical protein [Caudoviricetes sp.]